MHKILLLGSSLAMLWLAACAHVGKEAPTSPGLHAEAFSRKITKTVGYRYALYLPNGYDKDPAKRWPLIIFLHGIGERGNDLALLQVNGIPRKIADGESFPFIIAAPQCPDNDWWSPDTINALLDELIERHRVDEDRVYLTGLSMGGFGTWSTAAQYPGRFAAIAPICGGGNAFMANNLKHTPTWAFHGAKDETVPIKRSQEMVDALKACGGEVKFTVYPEAGHDSWSMAYNTPELYQWFLQHRRQKAN